VTAGRRPDPAAVQDAKGNPGKRARRTAAPLPDGPGARPHANLRPTALKIWGEIAPELERMNLLRRTDGAAFSRYCETLAAYWEITAKVQKIGATYETESAHGKMRRISPEFAAQERLFNRLIQLEDRFGLSPASRQQILLRAAGAPQGSLPLGQPKSAQDPEAPAEPAVPASPIGLLN